MIRTNHKVILIYNSRFIIAEEEGGKEGTANPAAGRDIIAAKSTRSIFCGVFSYRGKGSTRLVTGSYRIRTDFWTPNR